MPSAPLPSSLILVGAGKMGGAMLEGWLKVGMPGSGVTVIDPRPSDEMARLCSGSGIALNPVEPRPSPEVLVLATKPQMLDDAAERANALLGPQTLLVSILAGKTIGDLRDRLPEARAVIRRGPPRAPKSRNGSGLSPTLSCAASGSWSGSTAKP
jgi:pyrroline-5-carboxylate reductase